MNHVRAWTRWTGAALLACQLGVAQAAWVYFGDVYNASNEFYDNAIQNKGTTSVIKTFSMLPVPEQAPVHDPKAKVNATQLVKYRAELSSYEFNCKNKTVQLVDRTFYADPDGKFPIVTHKAKDAFITDSNSSFSSQFLVKPVYPNNYQAVKLMGLACK